MVMRFGDLTIDEERFQVTVSGNHVHLTYQEFNALRYIAVREGRVATAPATPRAPMC